MTLFQSLALGVVQGITEFLPVSSSGHLNLLSRLLQLSPSLTFDIFLNFASFFSVLFYFRRQTRYFFNHFFYVILGSLPAVVIGLLFKTEIEAITTQIKLLPFFFLILSFILIATRLLPSKNLLLTPSKALIIGLFQALALLPGISRSGSTIFAGLLVGLSPLEAFNFSFCLFVPASVGALLLDFNNLNQLSIFQPNFILSFIVTFLVGLLALNFLQNTLRSSKYWYFGVYTLLLVITLFFFGL